jgi:hypothetical protein
MFVRQFFLQNGWLGAFAGAVVAFALAGCDPQRIAQLEEGVATEADVRAQFGEPEAVWEEPGGIRVFEYNRQPEGHKNYHISIGPDGKMSALRQLLTPENFAKVQPGMPMETVRKMLGKPAEVKPYALSQETHMSWRFMEAGTHHSKMFSAVLNKDLKVVRTEMGVDMKSEQFKGG